MYAPRRVFNGLKHTIDNKGTTEENNAKENIIVTERRETEVTVSFFFENGHDRATAIAIRQIIIAYPIRIANLIKGPFCTV